ncbi:MAG: acylglycerol kinase family protein [Longimicrobiales bacterium]|nr:acylglycerol kinase family protein [Longimicrobiales bacterium]
MLVLYNPLSGRLNRRGRTLQRIEEALPAATPVPVVGPEETRTVLAHADVDHRDLVCVAGGDGSVQAVLTALQALLPNEAWPVIAPLPTGSTNMTASDLGMGRLGRALGAARGAAGLEGTDGPEVERAVLLLEPEGSPPLCGMFFGLGAITEGVEFFRTRLRGGGPTGESLSLLSILRVMVGMLLPGGDARGSVETELTLEGGASVQRTLRLGLATTLNRLVLGFRPYWGSEPAPIHFTAVDHQARAVWPAIPRIARGRPGPRLTPERGYRSRNVHRLELRFPGSFVLDGEVYPAPGAHRYLRLSAPRTVRWVAAP